MTQRSPWTSQPLIAAHSVVLAWVVMRVVYAHNSGMPVGSQALASVAAMARQVASVGGGVAPVPILVDRIKHRNLAALNSPAAAPAFKQSIRTNLSPRDAAPLVVKQDNLPLDPPPVMGALPSRLPKAAQQALPTWLPSPSSRWSVRGSGWMLSRAQGDQGSVTPSVATPGQLGGSQAGIRIYASPPLEALAGLSLTSSLSWPLATKTGREASLGLAWQPRRSLPVTLIAERREGIGPGSPSRFMAVAAGGLPERPLAGRWTIRGYAQAGIAGARRKAGFADGAVELSRPVIRSGPLAVEAGLGSWAAVQPGVHRIDLGPRLDVIVSTLPRPVRFSLQWRQRVDGKARPGSGLALVAGSDF
jgi:hypothetical protein